MRKIELLAPAGNMECLYAAIEGGADAIYLGGTLFSARAFAGNFTNEELKKAIQYCHLYGVKVYVTCNIIVYENEVEKFMNYIDFLYQNGADAIIIQDLGMLDLIHKTYPYLELHASTQMHIHNLDGVIMANKLGCSRVVLARETSLETVKDIIDKTGVDIEIFGHGSLCVSYSGQCLFSSLIGHRSGNRGSCVGSCRLPYKILDENNKCISKGDYPLSMKDLNTLNNLDKLIQVGVTSLKIEGRMKSKEYVYTVTKLYRQAIDSYYAYGKIEYDKQLLINLQHIYSRSYTKGYLFHEEMANIINSYRPNHQGIPLGKVINYQKGWIQIKLDNKVKINDGLRIVLDKEDYGFILNEFYINKVLVKEAKNNDIISVKVNKIIPINSQVLLTKDDELIEKIDKQINSKERKVPISITIKAKIDEPLLMQATDEKNTVEVLGSIVQKANKKAISKEEIIEKINMIGDTIYKIENLNIQQDKNIFISFSELKELRRRMLNELSEKRINKINYCKKNYQIDVPNYQHEELKSVLVNKDKENLPYDIIYSEERNSQNIQKLPKVMINYDKLDKNKEYLIGELGAFNTLKKINTDYSFNVVNSYTVALLHHLGAKRITLSLELNEKQIEAIIKGYQNRYHKNPNLEVIRSGYREVMTLKTNFNKIYNQDKLYLEDRFNNKYLIRNMDNISYIYEPHKYFSDVDYYKIGVNVLRDNEEIFN